MKHILVLMVAVLWLSGCGESIGRGVVTGASDSVQAKLESALKARAESDKKADAAIKTSSDAKSEAQAARGEAAEYRKLAQAADYRAVAIEKEETALYRAEVSHSIRLWAIVTGIAGIVSFALGCWLAISSATTALGIWSLITGHGSGRGLRIAGAIAIAAGAVAFVLAPAWWWILIGIVCAVGAAIIAALIYEAETHKAKAKTIKEEGDTALRVLWDKTQEEAVGEQWLLDALRKAGVKV